MENNEFVEKLQEFLASSKSFEGIGFLGMYTMHLDKFFVALRYYLDSGENVLDEYSQIMWLFSGNAHFDLDVDAGWSPLDDGNYTEKECEIIMDFLAGDSFWNIYEGLNTEQIRALIQKVKKARDCLKNKKYKKNRRNKASSYTADPELRKKIFERDGEICCHCGATTDLTIDHIDPVVRGGEDTEDNIQILCRTCNSTKGGR